MVYRVSLIAASLQVSRDDVKNSVERLNLSPVEDSPVRDRQFTAGAYQQIAADCQRRLVDRELQERTCIPLWTLDDAIGEVEKHLGELRAMGDELSPTQVSMERANEILAAMPWKPRLSLHGQPLFTPSEARSFIYALQAWCGLGRIPENHFLVGGSAIPLTC